MENISATDDLTELEFSPLTPEEVNQLEGRAYLLDVHANAVKQL